MRSKTAMLLSLLLVLCFGVSFNGVSPSAWAASGQDKKDQDKKEQDKKDKKDSKKKSDGSGEAAPDPKETERQIGRLMKEIQFDLEGGSSRSFLSKINREKFDDYPRFEDNVERLMRDNTLRVHFRTAFTAPPTSAGAAQSSVDSLMELVKKDSAGAPQRRQQQLTFDFTWTNRGWRIINITPRSYFQP